MFVHPGTIFHGATKHRAAVMDGPQIGPERELSFPTRKDVDRSYRTTRESAGPR